MEQPTINQFFVTRKRNSSIPPTKRRKLDVTNVETKISKARGGVRGKAIGKSKNKAGKNSTIKCNQVKIDHKSMGLRDILNATPLEETNEHISPKRKTGKIHRDKDVDEVFTAVKSIPHCPPTTGIKHIIRTPIKCPVTPIKSKLPINDDINDQAKTILYSRGSTILRAGIENKSPFKSPSKVSEILYSLSPRKESIREFEIVSSPLENILQKKTPVKKLSDILNAISPRKESINTECTVPVPEPDRRARLRNKFAHLLKDIDSVSGSSPTTTNDISEIKAPVSQDEKCFKEKAHEKFKHLAQKTAPTGFVLPLKFKALLEMFRCTDSVLFLLNQRSEVCTFERLKKSVQSMCGRDFDLKHLAAMKTVCSTAFIFRQEKGLRTSNGPSNAYQLTIEANFKESFTSNSSKLSPNVLITRRLNFETKLLDIAKTHHQKFLRKLNMKIPESEIHRWHPHFKVNDVPDIAPCSLPQPPIHKGFTSAAELILRNKGNLDPKVQEALRNAANKTSQLEARNIDKSKIEKKIDSNEKDGSDTKTTSETKIKTNSKLKGVSQSLLERIRQKEQKKMHLAMTRDPEKEEKLSKMQRLPDIARILKAYFTSEKKAAITLEDCVQKLSESYGTSLPLANLEEHVRLLAEFVPEWLTIPMVRKFPFVKLTKGYDINKVVTTVNSIRAKESET